MRASLVSKRASGLASADDEFSIGHQGALRHMVSAMSFRCQCEVPSVGSLGGVSCGKKSNHNTKACTHQVNTYVLCC